MKMQGICPSGSNEGQGRWLWLHTVKEWDFAHKPGIEY